MNLYYGSNTFHIRHISSQNITLEKVMRLEMSNVTLLSLKGALQICSAHSFMNAYKAAVKVEIKCFKIGQCCRPHCRL